MYIHSNKDDRVVIDNCLCQGESYTSIAHRIHKNRSTVIREVKRNSTGYYTYRSGKAQKSAREKRIHPKKYSCLIEKSQCLENQIVSRLHPLVFSEVIAHKIGIHHQTIYSWIYRSRIDLIDQLPQ